MLPFIVLASMLTNVWPYSSTPWVTQSTNITTDFCVIDYDLDGDPDLVFCDYSYPSGGSVTLYRNDNGYLNGPVWESIWIGGCNCITGGDYDNDGDVDIAVGVINIEPHDGNNVIFKNLLMEGSINPFTLNPVWTSSDCRDAVQIEFFDIDSDGMLELIVGNMDSRICCYQNDSFSGLATDPADPFNTNRGAYDQRGFAISSFWFDLSYSQFLYSSISHLICCWGYERSTRVYENIDDWITPSFNPAFPDWSSDTRESGFQYICTDLNSDNYMDWLSFSDSKIYWGLSDDFEFIPHETDSVFVSLLHRYANVNVARLDIDNPDYIYLALAGRGYSNPGSISNYNAEDMLYFVDSWTGTINPKLVWTSDECIPSLAVGFSDFDPDYEELELMVISTTLQESNQTFFLARPPYEVVSVILNNLLLQPDDYHVDLEDGQVSLIGGTQGDRITIRYTVTYGNDLIVARSGCNAVYYHD